MNDKRDAIAEAKRIYNVFYRTINPSNGTRAYGKTLAWKMAKIHVEGILDEFSRLRMIDNVENLSSEFWNEVKFIIDETIKTYKC